MSEKIKAKIISISMPENEVDHLHQLAKAFKLSTSKLIREAIKLWESEETDEI